MKIEPFNFKYVIGKDENCFSYLPKLVEEIDQAATKFLDQFDFISSDDMAEFINSEAWKLFKQCDRCFSRPDLPEWAADVIDSGVPYCSPPRNGSLWYSLGYSVTSQDAHLRCFYENVKNGTDFTLPFPLVVPKTVFNEKTA